MNVSVKKYLLIFLVFPWNICLAQTYGFIVKYRSSPDTAGISSLFNQCANLRTFHVINKKNNESVNDIYFTVSQGTIKKKNDYYQIEPAGDSVVTVSAMRKKSVIARQTYKILPVPDPEINFILSGKNTVLNNGSAVDLNDTISFRFLEGPAFGNSCPGDTLFAASRITVVKSGNRRYPVPVNGSFQLNHFGLNSGETIKLELNRYIRTNYNGTTFESDASPDQYLILKIK